jgi:hypothetical protein
MLIEDLKYITIEYLLNTNLISVRTANCCHNAEFESLYDIISYYEQGESFRTIRNSGKLTCEELENLCEGYLSNLSDLDFQNVENKNLMLERKTEGELLYESLSTNQSLLIEQKYLELLSHYSVRTCNGLQKFTANEFIESYLFCDSNELIKIKNIGKKSITEIIEFRSKLMAFIEEIKYIDDSPLECIKLKTVNKYGDFCDNDFIPNFYEKHSHLPMFWILEQYIISDKSKEIEILIDSFHIVQHRQLLSNQEIAQKLNLTRERVRQLRNGLFHNVLRIPITFVNNKCICKGSEGLLRHKEDWQYILSSVSNADILHTGSAEIQNHLAEEKSNFSFEFCLQIISFIFQDIYTLMGGVDVPKKDRFWDNTFLIKKEFSNIFDFEKLREEFSNVLIDNDDDLLLDIEDYVANSQCWIKYDFDKTDSIINILRDILLYEFHLYSEDIDGYIKIPANKGKKPMAVLYEILQQNGRPMHLNEIFLEFKNILPDHKYTEAAQLRPYLQKHEAISYRNRKSVYTLKEWEHIKTGTIRDAIVEFLLENDLPQTADEITEYVLQYFPETNIASVRTTMFNDTQKRFSFFNDNIFGLKDKEYPSECELGEQQEVLRKSFEQRLLDLELFIVEEGHFPFASNEKSKEGSLGRWWYRIINNRQQINDAQLAEVNRVKVQYAEYDTDKTTYEWNLNYNKFKCFLLENRRIPSARGDEKFLYGWLRRAKEDFQNYKLTEEQRQRFIDLAKLI